MAAGTFDGFVDVLRRGFTFDSKQARFRGYLDDIGHVRQLLRAVDDGLELMPGTIAAVTEWGLMRSVGATHFRENSCFDEDDRFTSTRFAMVFQYHRAVFADHGVVMVEAGAQLDRMFAAGRVSPDLDYLTRYANQVDARVKAGGDVLGLVSVAAHFTVVREVLGARVREAEEFGGVYAAAPKGTLAQIGYEAQRVLTAVDEQRAKLFRERWLRSALSEAEWLGAGELASAVLQNLYPQVWADGYAGYHQRVRNEVATWLG